MINFIKNFQESSTRNQFLAAISINLLTFSHGAVIGWASPFLPLLQSKLSPIGPITIEEVSWIGSCFPIGGVTGILTFAVVSQYVGKKHGIMLLAVPHIAFWFLILFGNSVYYLFAARILGGCTGGGIIRQFSLYITDISENHVRGILFSIYPLTLYAGVSFGFTTGKLLSYHTVPMLMLCFPVVFLLIVSFLPETPHCLLKANLNEEAENSFKFYRNIRTKGEDGMLPAQKIEFELLKKMVEATNQDTKADIITFGDFTNKIAMKGLSIGLFLVALNQFSGCFAIMTYTETIFEESGSSLNSNMASIIVAVLQILGAYCSMVFVDRVGRKILLLVSASGATIGLASMGCFSYLNKHGYDVSSVSWIPIVSLSCVVFFGAVAILTLPYLVIAELLPNKIRAIGTTICLAFMYSCSFLVVKTLPVLMITLELHGCMWLFSGICVFGTIVILLFVPETKGISLVDGIEETRL